VHIEELEQTAAERQESPTCEDRYLVLSDFGNQYANYGCGNTRHEGDWQQRNARNRRSVSLCITSALK
jgi:hypothetical protein